MKCINTITKKRKKEKKKRNKLFQESNPAHPV